MKCTDSVRRAPNVGAESFFLSPWHPGSSSTYGDRRQLRPGSVAAAAAAAYIGNDVDGIARRHQRIHDTPEAHRGAAARSA